MVRGGKEMKKMKILSIGLLCILLIAVPVVADAHGGFAGAAFLGFGLGLFTGFAFAPRPVYAVPPVYYAPPPPAVYRYNPSYVPAPVPPATSYGGYSENVNSPSVSPPSSAGRCREWRLIDRHLEDRWDSYQGRWQKVLVERFGWVGVPCRN
jgi:hypothetical protein